LNNYTKIRIYDEEKKGDPILKLGGEEGIPGHSSRVYCIKFGKEDNPQLVYTAGWDKMVHIWDMREGKPFARDKGVYKGIYGPLICGDGIDIHSNLILTSSWTQTN